MKVKMDAGGRRKGEKVASAIRLPNSVRASFESRRAVEIRSRCWCPTREPGLEPMSRKTCRDQAQTRTHRRVSSRGAHKDGFRSDPDLPTSPQEQLRRQMQRDRSASCEGRASETSRAKRSRSAAARCSLKSRILARGRARSSEDAGKGQRIPSEKVACLRSKSFSVG